MGPFKIKGALADAVVIKPPVITKLPYRFVVALVVSKPPTRLITSCVGPHDEVMDPASVKLLLFCHTKPPSVMDPDVIVALGEYMLTTVPLPMMVENVAALLVNAEYREKFDQ